MVDAPSRPQDPGAKSSGVVLVVDGNQDLGEETVRSLTQEGISATWVSSAQQAIDFLEKRDATVVFTDIEMMPGAMNGIGLARWIVNNRPGTQIILTSATFPWLHASSPFAKTPFMMKPVNLNRLLVLVRDADIGR